MDVDWTSFALPEPIVMILAGFVLIVLPFAIRRLTARVIESAEEIGGKIHETLSEQKN